MDFGQLVQIVLQEADLLLLSQRSAAIFRLLPAQGFLHARLEILDEEFAKIVQRLQLFRHSLFQSLGTRS